MTEDQILDKAQRISEWNGVKLRHCIKREHQRTWTVRRGEVYQVDLGENIGSEENKCRPVVVLGANKYSYHSPVCIVAIITSSPMTNSNIQVPITGTYSYIDAKGNSVTLHGCINLGQIRTVAKERITSKTKLCVLTDEIDKIDQALFNVFGLTKFVTKQENIIKSLEGKVEDLQKKIK